MQGTVTEFAYLGDNSRESKTVNSGTPTEYLWDRAGGLPRLIDDGTTSAVHAGGVLAEVDNSTSDRSWALRDGLGSVRARGDDSGVTTDTADWDAWGEATTAPAGLFGWAGEQADPETGLTYLRARYYSPVYGRFLSRDSISPNAPGTQGYNPYAYARNNPVTFTDPSGLIAAGGLAAVGQSIANAFWYLAYILECFTVGECRHERRHDQGSGPRPSNEGGKPPGSTFGTTGGHATLCARLPAELCGSLLPGFPTVSNPTLTNGNGGGRMPVLDPSDCSFSGCTTGPADRGAPPADDGLKAPNGNDCSGVNGVGPTWEAERFNMTAYWYDDCVVREVEIWALNNPPGGIMSPTADLVFGTISLILAGLAFAVATPVAVGLGIAGTVIGVATYADLWGANIQNVDHAKRINMVNANAQGGFVGVVGLLTSLYAPSGNIQFISQADWVLNVWEDGMNFCLNPDNTGHCYPAVSSKT